MSKAAAGLEILYISTRLREIDAARIANAVSPLEAGDIRSKALCEGVALVAKYFGVTLKPIHCIDSNGELMIASERAYKGSISGAPFSKEFCDVLNAYAKPRCGMIGTVAIMEPEHSNWCRINHFNAEKMVLAIADAMV